MKIVADEMIPCVKEYFAESHDIILKDGRAIDNNDCRDADILLVRAVTTVDRILLTDTNVKWVASTTSGCDHLDVSWLKSQAINVFVAQGCNAQAVAEYVISVIAAAQQQRIFKRDPLRVGIIGLGQIGQRLLTLLTALNIEVLVNDPLRAQQEKDFTSTPLDKFTDLDMVSLHVPLTFLGDFPTYHLIAQDFLQRQKQGALLINTSRGAVINSQDLKEYGQHLNWCLDVWENEPNIDRELMDQCLFATPHMAGYSRQSKQRGIDMVYDYFVNEKIVAPASRIIAPKQILDFNHHQCSWQDVVLKIFDPKAVTEKMKQAQPLDFDAMRKTFFDRCEFSFAELKNWQPNTELDKQVIQKLF